MISLLVPRDMLLPPDLDLTTIVRDDVFDTMSSTS